MSKRRRMFDIDIPEADDDAAAPATTPKPQNKAVDVPALETKSTGSTRPGPMASAVRESAEAARMRLEAEVAARTENDRLAHEHVRLKRLGLITDLIALDRVDTNKLRRDRLSGHDEELDDLVESIRDLGLSNPIRVEQAGDRYELIQGYRRLQAYKALLAETGDETWATIPAGMVAAGDDLARSYRRMVDENLIRKDISFAEMAILARDYAADPETDVNDVGKAVADLYASAGYQKRSYIRAFAELLAEVGDDLLHSEDIPRNLGLAVRKQLANGNPGLADLQSALRSHPGRASEAELSILRGFVSSGSAGLGSDLPGGADKGQGASRARKAKTSFRLTGRDGELRCTASSGKLELRGTTDFSGFDRRRLEAAVQAFLDALDASD